MTFSELPQETQDRLNKELQQIRDKRCDCIGTRSITLWNANKTRCLQAFRIIHVANAYVNGTWRGTYSYWEINYFKPQDVATKVRQVMGYDYEWREHRTFYSASANGTVIPNNVKTKKEVLALAKSIGIFNI